MIARENDVLARNHVLRLLPSASYLNYLRTCVLRQPLLDLPIFHLCIPLPHTPVLCELAIPTRLRLSPLRPMRPTKKARTGIHLCRLHAKNIGPDMNRLPARYTHNKQPISSPYYVWYDGTKLPRRANRGIMYKICTLFDFAYIFQHRRELKKCQIFRYSLGE